MRFYSSPSGFPLRASSAATQPFHVLRQGRFEGHPLAGARVIDFQAPGVQHLPPHTGKQGLEIGRAGGQFGRP